MENALCSEKVANRDGRVAIAEALDGLVSDLLALASGASADVDSVFEIISRINTVRDCDLRSLACERSGDVASLARLLLEGFSEPMSTETVKGVGVIDEADTLFQQTLAQQDARRREQAYAMSALAAFLGDVNE